MADLIPLPLVGEIDTPVVRRKHEAYGTLHPHYFCSICDTKLGSHSAQWFKHCPWCGERLSFAAKAYYAEPDDEQCPCPSPYTDSGGPVPRYDQFLPRVEYYTQDNGIKVRREYRPPQDGDNGNHFYTFTIPPKSPAIEATT